MKASMAIGALLVLALASSVHGQGATNQLSTSQLPERAQRALFSSINGSFLLPVNNGLPASNVVDNAAARQLVADKSGFPFLATLPNQGFAAFITTLKACALILPHVHPRGSEQYVIISGTQTGGIAEENGGRQNLTFQIPPGSSFVVPQGLVHYNFNNNCVPNVFIQVFSSADAGTIGLNSAISGLTATGQAPLAAGNYTGVTASPQGAFALEPTCLQRCGLTATGGGFNGLSAELQQFIGVSGASTTAAPGASTAAGPGAATGGSTTTGSSSSTTTTTTITSSSAPGSGVPGSAPPSSG